MNTIMAASSMLCLVLFVAAVLVIELVVKDALEVCRARKKELLRAHDS